LFGSGLTKRLNGCGGDPETALNRNAACRTGCGYLTVSHGEGNIGRRDCVIAARQMAKPPIASGFTSVRLYSG